MSMLSVMNQMDTLPSCLVLDEGNARPLLGFIYLASFILLVCLIFERCDWGSSSLLSRGMQKSYIGM